MLGEDGLDLLSNSQQTQSAKAKDPNLLALALRT